MPKKERIFNNLLHKKIDSHPIFKEKLTLGQRAADKLTNFGGSWTFLILLGIYMTFWIGLNMTAYIKNWDPWPFIILNLTLSLLAAAQAPVILMAQNRQTERDRIDAKYDHQVNRKAEREIQTILKDIDSIKRMIRNSKK